MRKFKCCLGLIVDLDDPKTYKHLPKTMVELDALMFKEIGYANCYMNYIHKNTYKAGKDGGQKKRVKKLIKNFIENRQENFKNVMWFKEQVFLFIEEIENMC